MFNILNEGQEIYPKSSSIPCTIEKFLGGGGQGEVYQAKWADKQVAVKWYFPQVATLEQYAALELLIRKQAPNDKFLWPIELVKADGIPGFGYIMPLRLPQYKGIIDLMKARVDPSFRALATTGMELADSYLQLHALGFCYRDISYGNVFFEPDSGSVLICDNDNVGINDSSTNSGVLGTLNFMAPEIIRGEALPSTQTDLYSLAVLLFYIFMLHHPLEGEKEYNIKCLNIEARKKLYGYEPVFIFDPDNVSNRPVTGFHDTVLAYWDIYPQFLRDKFIEAFTKGIKDPQHGRVTETIWRKTMVALRDSIFYCSHCGAENFYNPDIIREKSKGIYTQFCWQCKSKSILPYRIRISRNPVVMLNQDSKLYPHHIDDRRMYNFSEPIAEVAQHPKNPSILGLKNLSNDQWTVTKTDGSIHPLEKGKSITLSPGIKINFGTSEGEVRY